MYLYLAHTNTSERVPYIYAQIHVTEKRGKSFRDSLEKRVVYIFCVLLFKTRFRVELMTLLYILLLLFTSSECFKSFLFVSLSVKGK